VIDADVAVCTATAAGLGYTDVVRELQNRLRDAGAALAV
jgi:hypothetical protein